MPTVNVRSKQSFTAHGSQTIATVAAHDCVVFIGCCVEDTIGTPTVGGVSMTGIGRRPTFPGAGGGYAVDIFYLKNASGGAVGTNVTFTDPYTHSNNFLGAIYVLQNTDSASQPQGTGGSESNNSPDPEFSMDCNDGDPARENAQENLKAAQAAFNEASVNAERFKSLRATQAKETEEAVTKANKELYEKIGLTRDQEREVERAAQQEREKRALDHETKIAEIKLKARQEAFKLAGKDTLAEIDALQTGNRIDTSQLFLKFKHDLSEALHGGPQSPAEVGKQFFTELFTKGQLTQQEIRNAVGKDIAKKAAGAIGDALNDISSFKGKDAIDFLLRKAGLKGLKHDDEVKQDPFSVYAESSQSSEGTGAGAALAESLGFAGSSSTPAQATAKNTEKVATLTETIQKDIASLKDAISTFASQIGVAGGSDLASAGSDF